MLCGLLLPEYFLALRVELGTEEPDNLDASLSDADLVDGLSGLGHTVGETLLKLTQEGGGNWGEWWVAHGRS